MFGEPPQMVVCLDGEKAGTTPLWQRQVGAGPYKLRIEGIEKDIRLSQGKAARIGLFEGSSICQYRLLCLPCGQFLHHSRFVGAALRPSRGQ